jgi:heme o synthase
VVAGRLATTRQILIYSVLLVPTSLLPWALGYAGALHGVVALTGGAFFVALALRLHRSQENDRLAAQRLGALG